MLLHLALLCIQLAIGIPDSPKYRKVILVTRISFLLLYTKQLFSQLPSHVCSLSTLSAPVLLPLPLFFHLPSPSSAFPLILVFFTHLTDVCEGCYGTIFFLKSCVSDKKKQAENKALC